MSICQGATMTTLPCNEPNTLHILKAFYGDIDCTSNAMIPIETMSALPTCGKFVTVAVSDICNNLTICSITVSDTVLNNNDICPTKNLYLEYDCGKCIFLYRIFESKLVVHYMKNIE